jgi:predicted regulator of Ras-like GTPase activity (Roadblock/LC7/MglB family)
MQRLVIALTTFLALMAGVVVAGYLLVFAVAADRASRAVPASASLYGTLYLQPSAGQKMNLAALLGHVPGFADATALDQKLHEIAGRLLGEAGLDYETDLRPWLGNQLAFGVEADGTDPAAAKVVMLVAVKDPVAAGAALDRIAEDLGAAGEPETYEGVELTVSPDGAWALLDDLLVLGNDAATVRAALDADADRAPSLADDTEFVAAMRRVPADHLAAVYVDLRGLAASAGAEEQLGGYSDASLALVVEQDGLRLAGNAPFDADAASPSAREAFAMASEPSSLADWMPDDTQAELVVFAVGQTFLAAEEQLGETPGTGEVTDAIDQLRGLAALFLGIDLDEDLLPLFDREAAVAVSGLLDAEPSGQLLLRPADPGAAQEALDRMRDSLRARGVAIDEQDVEGVTITSIDVPQIGQLSYAMQDGVIIAGLDPDQVGKALSAAAAGTTLGASARYRSAWELAGVRGGNEFWVDVAAAVDAAGEELGVTGDVRDILLAIDALAMTAPARDEMSEFHLVLTAR